jgi:hypothetical protein
VNKREQSSASSPETFYRLLAARVLLALLSKILVDKNSMASKCFRSYDATYQHFNNFGKKALVTWHLVNIFASSELWIWTAYYAETLYGDYERRRYYICVCTCLWPAPLSTPCRDVRFDSTWRRFNSDETPDPLLGRSWWWITGMKTLHVDYFVATQLKLSQWGSCHLFYFIITV